MVTINNTVFYEKPTRCGNCQFFNNGSTHFFYGSEKGHCRLYNEMHGVYINLPRRCEKLFNKALKFPEGSVLVIVTE